MVARGLCAARAGAADALGQVLEACRGYLLTIAQRELDPALQAKGGASDLVQNTLLDAFQDFGQFQGGTEDDLLQWLRRLLLNNLTDFTRRYRATDKRQVAREVPLEPGDASSAGLGELAGEGATPSGAALAREQVEAVQEALGRLPEDYRRVIVLRYQEGLPFEEIGGRLGLTANAARKLLLRAVQRVRQELGDPP
jgi:RNA polymerase sigma-70 factor (ECF subfamily)